MNKTMKLYTMLLRTFLKAGIMFGGILGLFLGMMTNWRTGMIYGILSGLVLWMGVSGLLLVLSVIKKRSHGGATDDK